MHTKNSHCSYCGQPFADAPWPRQCAQCSQTSFLNPLPVSVLLVPVEGGLLGIRRAIEPRRGQLALPGGFINAGESWQQAGVRELVEETGLTLAPEVVRLFDALSAPDGTLLVFGLTPPLTLEALPPFEPTAETAERVILTPTTQLAFPLHTQVAQRYFAEAVR